MPLPGKPPGSAHTGREVLLPRPGLLRLLPDLFTDHAPSIRNGSIVTITPASTPTPKDKGPDLRSRPGPRSRGHIGWIVAASLATGLVAALLLVAAPFIPTEESAAIGAVLCGFALGWASLAALSVRFSDRPQRWAAAPAVLMGLGGLL